MSDIPELGKILTGGKVLHILVDSKSLAQSHADDPEPLGFLRYSAHGFFDIKATSIKTGLAIIDSLPKFQPRSETIRKENLRRSKINKASNCGYDLCELLDIGDMAKKFLNKQTITTDEWKKVFGIFAHACLYHGRGPYIYVTGDEAVLQRRNWLRYYPTGKPINIVTVEEGKEIMDIFAKSLGQYIIAPGFSPTTQHHYYWLSFISKIPNYRPMMMSPIYETNTVPLGALEQRFRYILMCVDRMGIDYYRGVDLDAFDEMRFYFNHFITLMTAVFDSLAFETKARYGIGFRGDRNPTRISLNYPCGIFLEKVKEEDPDLRDHIRSNEWFIDMIRRLRNPTAHGSFRDPDRYSIVHDGLMRIDPHIALILSGLEDQCPEFDGYSEWGRTRRTDADYVSMYIFSKRVTLHLIDFVDLYLEKLGVCGYRIEQVVGSKKITQVFREERLGL